VRRRGYKQLDSRTKRALLPRRSRDGESDIVKPLWEAEVDVTGTRKGKQIQLMQIKEVSDE
jgi:hypothetical protein